MYVKIILWWYFTDNSFLVPENVVIEPEHRPDFLEKFLRLHKAMWTINSELTEPHPFESRPYEWPLLLTVIPFWQTETHQIILLGNPLVYWSSAIAVLTFLILFGFFQLREKRGCKDFYGGLRAYYETSAGFFVMGWAFHYIPFFYMKRQLFLHHYMPSLYFAVLTLGVGVDLLLRRFPRYLKLAVLVTSSACIAYTWWVYSPLAYGSDWTLAQCEDATLLKPWGLNCARYSPLGSVERESLDATEEVPAKESDIVYVNEQGNRVAIENVPQEYIDDEYMDEEFDEEEEEEEEGDEEEFDIPATEDDEPVPTDAPEPPEYEPEFVDGKEVVGEEDDEDDEWPRTIYGVDPEADEDDEDPAPLTIRKIPITKHFDL